MPDSEPKKKKMISLRLSDADYAVLKSQYRTHGARNMSDLARLALQQIIGTAPASPNPYQNRIADLEDRVHALECEISVRSERGTAKP